MTELARRDLELANIKLELIELDVFRAAHCPPEAKQEGSCLACISFDRDQKFRCAHPEHPANLDNTPNTGAVGTA